MLAYMLDTDVCVQVMRGRSQVLISQFSRMADRCCISTIVLAELSFGVEKSKWAAEALQAVEAFVAQIEVRPFTAEASARYGKLRLAVKRAGTPVGANDMLIAAHARSLGLTVLTNNRREFDRLPGLMVESWP